MNERPRSFKSLFEFYQDRFKPLYNDTFTLNQQSTELLLEVHAAFDHMAGHWLRGEAEEDCAYIAAGHLKRATFDAFKLVAKETRDHYDALQSVDTSIIDNGDFDRQQFKLFARIKALIKDARASEGNSRIEGNWDEAFEKWDSAYELCNQFEQKFHLNENVDWARKKQWKRRWWLRFEGFLISLVAGLVLWWVISFFGPG